jgi:hypothetical protein
VWATNARRRCKSRRSSPTSTLVAC